MRKHLWQSLLPLLPLLFLFISSSAEGRGWIDVTISPTFVLLPAGGTQQFTAQVNGTVNTAVTWSATGGTISPNGLYTAPSTGGTYIITAASAGDSSWSASATVTVIAPVVAAAVSIAPSAAALLPGGTQQFTATVTGTFKPAVTWSATGGTVSSSGFYVAPSTVGTYTVTATSVADASQFASATVTVGPPAAGFGLSYGNVGDPYQGRAPDPNAIPLSSCQALSANASYRLTGSVSAAAGSGSSCFTLSGPNTILDLGGFAVTGRITGSGIDVSGTVIFNGAVTCSFSDAGTNASNAGCIYLASSASVRRQAQLHHLTLSNTATGTTSAGSRVVYVDWWPPSPPASGYAVRAYNLTSSVADQPNASRIDNLAIFGGVTAEAAYNDLTCTAAANACQGILYYATAPSVMHDNRITLRNNTTANTARAMLFDGGSDFGVAYNNLVYVNNNRGLRIRDSYAVEAYSNTFKNITGVAHDYYGAVHLADPDTGNFDLGANIHNNSFEIDNGTGVWIRNGTNANIRNNIVTCTNTCSGRFGDAATPVSGGATSISFSNNADLVLGSPQIVAEAGASATLCNSGTGGGAGSITYINCGIPLPVPTVAVVVSPTSVSLFTGGTQQFTASVSGTTNTGVSWSATGGSISGNGLYTAPTTAGSYTVTATSAADSTKSASATVTVTAPARVTVSVSPSAASLSTGATQQFTASVSGTTNIGVSWSATGGSISGTGLYTAPSTAGNYRVTATSTADNTKSASATVTVTAPTAIAVSISPTSASLPLGGMQQFTAIVTGATNPAVSWSTTGGSVSPNGLYTAPSTAGSYTVTATSMADSTKSASAILTVTAPATVAVSVSPSAASLSTGGTQQFTATVTGTRNTAVTWSASGGTVSASGLYTAPSLAGTYVVTATSAADPTKSASAVVTVVGALQHSVTLNWNASSTSSVIGYNAYRATQSGGPYTMINTALQPGMNYVDLTVEAGHTYYYVVTGVDSSGMESVYSNEATAVVPLP